jgi:hypothetical protein
LQVHIAKEETKFGFDIPEARACATVYFQEKNMSMLQFVD